MWRYNVFIQWISIFHCCEFRLIKRSWKIYEKEIKRTGKFSFNHNSLTEIFKHQILTRLSSIIIGSENYLTVVDGYGYELMMLLLMATNWSALFRFLKNSYSEIYEWAQVLYKCHNRWHSLILNMQTQHGDIMKTIWILIHP